ncbi:MAG: HEAT repeat domain-containing protein [Verrucomicrobia bacterium]|nr:HEAT repeat domain-containing protein [Verrucomicrobiota bacterium]
MTLTISNLLRSAALVAAFALAGQLQAAGSDAAKAAEKQRELIAILKSGAPPAEKAIACKRLAIYGTSEAVSVLAPFLADEHLASWARIALQAIPDSAADDALREALGKLHGKLLIGVINTLGVRRDANSVGALSEKLKDSDTDVASAAAAALGRIGGGAAVKTLQPLLAGAPAAVRPAVAEGCILCAEQILAEGKADAAAKLFDAVRSANISKQKTAEATRGAILARGAAGVPLLVEQLRSKDKDCFNIAMRTVRDLPGREVTQALLAEMERVTPERQSYLLLALADRGDAETLDVALKAAKSAPEPQQLIAISVLDRLSNPKSAPALLSIAAGDDSKVAMTARLAVAKMPGAEVETAIVAMLKQPGENARRAAIELIAQRRIMSAIPELLKVAEDSNTAVSGASFKALGELAGIDEVPMLLGALMKAKDTEPAENALSAVCARLNRPVSGNVVILKAIYGALPEGPSADVTAKLGELAKTSPTVQVSNKTFGDPAGGKVKRMRVEYTVNGVPNVKTVRENDTIQFTATAVPPALVDALCAPMAQAPAPAKVALLRVLRSAGGPKALAAVRASASDANAEIKETAQRTLCDWQTADALPDVMQIAKTTTDKKFKVLALRGQLRLLPMQDASIDEKFASLKEAMALIERDEERRLALAALGEIPTAESLALVTPYLAVGNLKGEASIAAVAISARIVGKNPAQVAAAMQQVTTSDKKLAQQAKRLLAQAKGAAPKGKKK